MDIYTHKPRGGFIKAKKIRTGAENWIDLINPTEKELEEISKKLKIPPFILRREKRPHRPKFENFKDFVAFNFKTVQLNAGIVTKHITFIFAERFLLTIHSGLPQIKAIKEKIEKKDFEVRHVTDSDYLLYLILEDLVESFFPVLEKINERVEKLEQEIFSAKNQQILNNIFTLRQHVFEIHKILAAEREVLLFLHEGTTGIKERHVMYFRDLYNHLLQITDEEEIAREVLGTAAETYISVMNNRMQEIMKVLTVISTVLLPMTVITGIYGMNVAIPEARVPYIYYIILVALSISGVSTYVFFRKKRWL